MTINKKERAGDGTKLNHNHYKLARMVLSYVVCSLLLDLVERRVTVVEKLQDFDQTLEPVLDVLTGPEASAK